MNPLEYEIIVPLNEPDADTWSRVTTLHDEVDHVFKDNTRYYNACYRNFQRLVDGKIDGPGLFYKLRKLFKGHTDLIFRYNKLLPNRIQMPLSLNHDQHQGHQLVIRDAVAFLTNTPKQPPVHHITDVIHHHNSGTKMMKVGQNFQLPWDVLSIIFEALDFDDRFQFASVCQHWRAFYKMYWTNFLTIQEPLLLEMSSYAKKSLSFISLPSQKSYESKVINYFWYFAYCGYSSGYLIMTGYNNSFILVNRFTQRKKVIHARDFKVNFCYLGYHVLLVFGKGSEDFVLVTLCVRSKYLRVYQSRNYGWTTYSTMEIVDFVILHNTIYVVTNKANVGVLNLNSANVNFLELKSTPSVTSSSHVRLVSCDGQLLVVHTMPGVVFDVYKIDFSTMNYVKLETLGGIALFYAPKGNYYSLSNPDKWGYERNSVYVINYSSTNCKVYLGDDDKLPKYIRPDIVQKPPGGKPYLLDWCFSHLPHEIEYSLVE